MGIQKVTEVTLFVNGRRHRVINPAPTLSLNEWLRTSLYLTGAKVMCVEAGCGCCVVAVSPVDPMKDPKYIRAINSCLCLVMTLDGHHIITVEGIGNHQDGLHQIQEQIVDFFGTQCGYCTPGFIMSGYSLLSSNPKRTKREIEDAFDGNICRCTGYRPIMDAMKSFSDNPRTTDIEDFGQIKKIYNKEKNCHLKLEDPQICDLSSRPDFRGEWYTPENIAELTQLLKQCSGKNSRIVAGNTAAGINKDDGPFDVYISVNKVKEFSDIKIANDHLLVGAGITMSELTATLERNDGKSSFFKPLVKHISKIGNLPLRNAATWSGNLMLIHRNRAMASDVFLIFDAIGCTVNVIDKDGKHVSHVLGDFLELNMTDKAITGLRIPFTRLESGKCSFTGKVLKGIQSHFTTTDVIMRTFKIMPRSGNSYAYVSAAFLIAKDKDLTVKDTPCLMFGAVNERIMHATKTENFLKGKSLISHETLKGALALLDEELIPHNTKVTTDGGYRKQTAIDCFYKFYLQLLGDKADAKFRSAAQEYVKPISRGEHSFYTDAAKFPITQPLPKLEAGLQTTGEAKYINDFPEIPGELYAAAVTATVGNAILGSIDTSEAEKMPGFIAAVTAKDVPGLNVPMLGFFVPVSALLEMLVSEEIHYAGQIVALVIADTQVHANKIAKKVKITYKEIKKPILNIKDAVLEGSSFPNRIPDVVVGDVDDAFSKCEKVITGDVETGCLHHFHIETQISIVVPQGKGFKVYCATQAPALANNVVSKVLKVNMSDVEVIVSRVGGGFGGKGMYSLYNLALCAVAANKLRRPVRLAMDFNTQMRFQGNRTPYWAKYKVGMNKDGLLEAIDLDVAINCGGAQYVFDGVLTSRMFDNAYYCPNWKVKTIEYKTNTPPNTFLRAPGHSQSYFICETMMDHAAKAMGMAPDVFRRNNFYKDGQRLPLSPIPRNVSNSEMHEIWDELYKTADYANRRKQIDEFNKENRWRKKGLCIGPMKWVIGYFGFNFAVNVSIHYGDGTIFVNHGGVDIGQGINTRVAQIVAATLGVPMEIVTIRETTTVATANTSVTGGSLTSEINMIAAKKCCEILNERMKPVRTENPDGKWIDWVEECEKRRISLEAKYMEVDMARAAYAYDIYAAAVIEAELDVLTGEHKLPRADLLMNLGEGINPAIDLGQAEGAFVMGLGQYLHERLRYNKETGVELTDGTWEYKPPLAKDIPFDLRVTFSNKGPNKKNAIGSKASGEPPLLLAMFAYFAVKDAIGAARADASGSDDYFTTEWPLTVDQAQQKCLVDNSQLQF